MINPKALFKIKSAWETFCTNHPKFPAYIQAVKSQPIEEGTIVAMSITRPGEAPLAMNIKLTASDLELIQTLKGLDM